MAKVDLELVKQVLQRSELDMRHVAQIIEELNTEITAIEQEKEEKPPAQKKQFVILVSDPNGDLVEKDFTGWIVQVPEEDSPVVATERLIRASYEFNITPKGRRYPVKTIGEACEAVPTRLLKEQNVWVKTKEPVLVLRTDNQIPTTAPATAEVDAF